MVSGNLLSLRRPHEKIQSIKALRGVALDLTVPGVGRMGLREAKEAVEALEFRRGLLVTICEPGDPAWTPNGWEARRNFETYFEWEEVNKPRQLKLWEVTDRTGVFRYLVLAYIEDDALSAIPSAPNLRPTLAKEITGPFQNGQVLGKIV